MLASHTANATLNAIAITKAMANASTNAKANAKANANVNVTGFQFKPHEHRSGTPMKVKHKGDFMRPPRKQEGQQDREHECGRNHDLTHPNPS